MMFYRVLVSVVAVLFSLGGMASVSAQDDVGSKLVVVELYTSQGCSSCPPADALLAELATEYEDTVLPLSFHVDYWNYLGWRDPFAQPAFTQRQRDYATSFALRHVYTPQAVVGGRYQMTGSKRRALLRAIGQAASEDSLVDVHLSKTDTSKLAVHVKSEEGYQGDVADILLITFDKQHVTDVKRGENRGRQLTYYHVVRAMETIGRFDGTSQEIIVDLPSYEGIAVLVQDKQKGLILAAAKFDEPI